MADIDQSTKPKKLTLHPVTDLDERRNFVRMTIDLYKDDKTFVQPLDFEILARLDPKANPLLKENEHQLWFVKENQRIVGRIGAIINQQYIKQYGDKTGHFGYFESENNPDVINLLFSTAKNWLKERSMEKISGPYNFSVNEECGLLIDGYDRSPAVMMPHGKPYYQEYMTTMGFEKATDMYALWYPARYEFMPERRKKFVAKLLAKDRVEIRNFDFKNFEQEIITAVTIFNDAWANNWGFVPLSEAEAKHMASDLRPILEKHNTVMCLVDGEPSAFGIVLPNINEIIHDMNGKLLPLNWAKFLWRLKIKKVSTARMPLMGISQRFQGKPLGAGFAYKIIEMVNNSSIENGITHAELSWILESNKAMITMLEDIGAVIDKTYRIYEKPLS